MLRSLRLSLVALVVLLVPVSATAAKPPKPATCPPLCVKLGPRAESLPPKGLPKRQAALLRRARKAAPRLRPMLARARQLVVDGSLRRHAIQKPRGGGKARAAALGQQDAVPLGELDQSFANANATMSGRQFEVAEGRVGGGAATDVDVRGKNGSTAGVGFDDYGEGDRCPTADGIVRGDKVYATRLRAGAVENGRRVNFEMELRHEGRYTGHVGRGARAETVDWVGTGVVRVRIWEEDPKTGRVVKHHPTRTFRASLNIAGWPVDRMPDVDAARQMQLRGPSGRYYRDEFERKALLEAAKYAATGLRDAALALEEGDKRWYDDMACADAELDADRKTVRAGDRVRLAGRARAADGAPTNADWRLTTDCPGRLDPPAATGADVSFVLDDPDGAWKNGTDACVDAETLGPAGRARAGSLMQSLVERFRITFTGQGSHSRDREDLSGHFKQFQLETFDWRIVFDDVRIDGQPYGNVVPTDLGGRFDYGGHFGTAEFGCSGDVKAYSGEGVAPLGSIVTAPSADAVTLKLSAFGRLDPQAGGDCSAESLPNVAPDGSPGPYGVTISFDPREFFVEDRRRVGGKATFPADCGEPPSPGFTCTEEGEWSGEVLIEPAAQEPGA